MRNKRRQYEANELEEMHQRLNSDLGIILGSKPLKSEEIGKKNLLTLILVKTLFGYMLLLMVKV